MQRPDMLWQRPQRVEKIAYDAPLPAQLLLEQLRQGGGHGGPAQRIIINVGAIPAQQRLMRKEPVFPLVHGNSKPVAAANLRLNLQQQLAPDGEQASADATHAARPILGNFIDLKRGVVDKRLDRGDRVFVRISYSDSAADRSDLRLRKASCQLPDRLRMKDAIGINRDHQLR